MKKIIKAVIIIVVCLAAAVAGAVYLLTPDTMDVVVADRGSVSPTLAGIGKIEGDRKVTVYSDVAGVIDERYVENGERVRTGDLLAGYAGERQQDDVELAATDVEYSEKILGAASDNRAKYQRKYNEAVAQIENCKSVYALLEIYIMSINANDQAKTYQIKEQQKAYQNDIYKMQEEISEKQSDLSKIEADLKTIELKEETQTDAQKKEIDSLRDKSKEKHDDIKRLNEKISDAQRASLCLPQEGMDPETYKKYLGYQNDLETVTRLWSEARTDRDTAQSMLTAYKEIYADQQTLEHSKLSLSKAERELARAEGGTVAPADGIITNCLVDVGAYVEKGVPIFEMQSDESYKVRMMVSKFDIASVAEGQTADIKIGNLAYEGKVSKISQSAENDASGKAKASIEITIDTDDELIVGLEADVTLKLGGVEGVLRVPTECIYTDDDGSFVYITEGGTVAKKYVTTGVKDSTYTQIDGLDDGAHVVIDPGAAGSLGEEIKENIL